MNNSVTLFQKLAYYYGMTVEEFGRLINGDVDKLARFVYDDTHNHN